MWTEHDRALVAGLMSLPELRGRMEILRPFLNHPAEAFRDARVKSRIPLPLRERLDPGFLEKTGQEILETTSRQGFRVVGFADDEYPERLRPLPNPPLLLWVHGKGPLPNQPSLAVVGSRSATGYGRNAIDYLLDGLKGSSVWIISGLARGVDTFAHEWALEHGVSTLAVVGHGLDSTYPRGNANLRRAIINSGGIVMSELPPGTPPRPELFPLRNRIISGLAHVVLVVEAPPRSGALNTARWALDHGREVLAVPGSIFQTTSMGTNYIIQQGWARPAITPNDIIQAFPEWVCPTPQPALCKSPPHELPSTKEEDQILVALSLDQPTSIDTLLETTGFPPERLYPILLELETQGKIMSIPGHRYLKRPEPSKMDGK